MKNQVLALPEVRDYFSDLIRILYEKDYFGFESDAIEYVTDLFSDIEQNLPAKPRKPAPPYFEKFGKDLFYTTFRKTSTRNGLCSSTFIQTASWTFKPSSFVM